MQSAKLVIFDLDGTIIDAYPAIIESFNHAMRYLGYPQKSSLVIRRAVGWGDEALLRGFVRKTDLRKVLSAYRRHHAISLLKLSRLMPGALGILGYLKNKGYKMAVASNRPTRFSLILIKHLGLQKYFDYILCADKLKEGKPHPEILNKIIKRLSFKKSEAIYVGDMTIDAQAGRRAKVRTIIVTTGSSSKREISGEKPFRIIAKIGELSAIL